MRIIKALTLCAILGIFAMGCSSVMPSPEVEQVGTDPVALTGTDTTGTAKLTITFVCRNHIDAYINNCRIVFRGANTQTSNTKTDFYVPGDGSKAELEMEWDMTSLNALRTAIGFDSNNLRTMTFTFSGTDAYGYNKTFTVKDFTISF